MKTTHVLAGALALLAPHISSAQQVSGGVSLSYSAYNDESDLNQTILEGQVQVDFTRAFGLQFDVGTTGRDAASDALDGQVYNLHSIYHFDQNSSFGFFVGQSDLGDVDTTRLGLEYNWESRTGEVEVALSNVDVDGLSENGLRFELNGVYDLSYAWSLTGGLELENYDDSDRSIIEIGTEYNFGQGGAIFAGLGSFNVDFDGGGDFNDTYIKVGASFDFGNDGRGGVTFDKRGFERH
jgi:hypothetical protein